MRRRNTRIELWLAYGLIAGAAAGTLLLAFTGSVWGIVVLPGVGLLVGLAISNMRHRSTDARP